VNAPQTTNINLEHTFSITTTSSNQNQQQKPPAQVIYRPETTTTQWIPPPTTPTTPNVVYVQQTTRLPVFIQETTTQPLQRPQPAQTQDFKCGVPNIKSHVSTGLIVKGKTAIRGQFPW
jgi:hypothetical protein